MLCRFLTQDFDLKPALFFDFPKQGLFWIFVQFNVAAQWKPLVELLMIDQKDTIVVYHKCLDCKVHTMRECEASGFIPLYRLFSTPSF